MKNATPPAALILGVTLLVLLAGAPGALAEVDPVYRDSDDAKPTLEELEQRARDTSLDTSKREEAMGRMEDMKGAVDTLAGLYDELDEAKLRKAALVHAAEAAHEADRHFLQDVHGRLDVPDALEFAQRRRDHQLGKALDDLLPRMSQEDRAKTKYEYESLSTSKRRLAKVVLEGAHNDEASLRRAALWYGARIRREHYPTGAWIGDALEREMRTAEGVNADFAMSALLRDGDEQQQQAAADWLVERARAALAKPKDIADPTAAQPYLGLAFGDYSHPRVAPRLVKLIEGDGRPAARLLRARMLPVRGARAVPQLVAMLDDEDPEVAEAAAESLGGIAPPQVEAIDPLVDALFAVHAGKWKDRGHVAKDARISIGAILYHPDLKGKPPVDALVAAAEGGVDRDWLWSLIQRQKEAFAQAARTRMGVLWTQRGEAAERKRHHLGVFLDQILNPSKNFIH